MNMRVICINKDWLLPYSRVSFLWWLSCRRIKLNAYPVMDYRELNGYSLWLMQTCTWTRRGNSKRKMFPSSITGKHTCMFMIHYSHFQTITFKVRRHYFTRLRIGLNENITDNEVWAQYCVVIRWVHLKSNIGRYWWKCFPLFC